MFLTILFLLVQLAIVRTAFLAEPVAAVFIRCAVLVVMATAAFSFLVSKRMNGTKGVTPSGVMLLALFFAGLVADLASITYGGVFATVAAASFLCMMSTGKGTKARESGRIILTGLFLSSTTASIIYGAVPASIGGIMMLIFSGMRGMTALKSLRFRGLLFLAPLIVLGCSPLKPSGGRYQDATVMFSLSGESLNLMRDENLKVRVRVHKVEADVRGDQEGSDHMFTADSAPVFRIGGVRMGLKDFVVDVLSPASESVGHAEVRYLVRPGTQSLPEVRIRLVPPAQRRRLLEMNWQVVVNIPGEDPKTTYLDVKETFDDYCISCHGADSRPEPAGKLVLSSFPFYYIGSQHEPAAIVADSLYWMKAPDYPMPPPPMARVPQDKISLVQKWLDDGLQKFPAANSTDDLARKLEIHWQLEGTGEKGHWEIDRTADPANPFPCSLENAVVGGRYTFRAEVFGIDGSKTAEQSFEHVVAPEGITALTIEIEGTAPDVSIPVVIEQ